MKHYIIFICFSLLLFSCDDELVIDTTKDTFSDPLADITALGNYIYTTNYDLSYNSGSQIDLLRFTIDGILDNQFDLRMNGQGYIAITNDGSNIYLFSRNTNLIVKVTPTGEKIYLKQQKLETNWSAAGICYLTDRDSLLFMYQNLRTPAQYRIKITDKNNPDYVGTDIMKTFNEFSGDEGTIFSVDYSNSNFYFLGIDTTNSISLKITDNNFYQLSFETISDSTIMGMCVRNGDVYFSHNDRRIIKK
ncbi:MAG: hypothetical protein JW866_02060 [Ignavibacteriales bacterium]|nr:hypothetical protein [Ignavibacteriales bacterium]